MTLYTSIFTTEWTVWWNDWYYWYPLKTFEQTNNKHISLTEKKKPFPDYWITGKIKLIRKPS